MKQATITNRVWSIKRQHSMDDDDFLVWMFLRVNSETTITGLYEISPHDMALHLCPKSPSLLLEIMQRLQGYGVITHDNGLVFVPDIPFDQNFHSYGHKKSTLAKTRKELGKYRSEIGGRNRAFLAFDAWHEDTLAEIAMDEEFEAAHASQEQLGEFVGDTTVTEDQAELTSVSGEERSNTTPILPPTTPSYHMGSDHYPPVALKEENNNRKYSSISTSELGGGVGEGPPPNSSKNPSAADSVDGSDGGGTLPYEAPSHGTEASGPPHVDDAMDGQSRPSQLPRSAEFVGEREEKAFWAAVHAKTAEIVGEGTDERSVARSTGGVLGRQTERPIDEPASSQRKTTAKPPTESDRSPVVAGSPTFSGGVAKAGTTEATTFPPDTEQVRAVMDEYVSRENVRSALGEHVGRINTAKEALKFLDHYATFRRPAWTKTNNLPVTDWVQAVQHWIREWPRFNLEDDSRSGATGEAQSDRSLLDIDREESELLQALTGELQ